MGRSSTVELRFLVPAVGGSNPSVPAPKNIALQALMNLERFFVGKRRDSNPQGCGAEETRSVFQRSTQGAKRRSGARPPTRRTRNPSVPHQPRAPHVKQIEPTPPSGGIRTRKGAERCSGARPPQADAVSALGDAPKCRHYRNVPKCRLGTIFEDPPKDCGQKTANMSTVTVVATLFSLKKEDLNEIYSHQGLPLMNT